MSIADDEQNHDPAIVAMAKALMPLAWMHEGGPRLRDTSLKMAARARAQFQVEQETADHMVWEMGVLHGRRQTADERAQLEGSPGHHWRGFWRALFRRRAEVGLNPVATL